MYDRLPKPVSLSGYHPGVGWFMGVTSVWLLAPFGKQKGCMLVWTDHDGYDAGMIRNPTQKDVVRVLTEAFLTDLS